MKKANSTGKVPNSVKPGKTTKSKGKPAAKKAGHSAEATKSGKTAAVSSMQVRIAEAKKLASVEATGADCLVACDAGCLMQMGGGLSRRGSRVRALHLAQVLAPEGPP